MPADRASRAGARAPERLQRAVERARVRILSYDRACDTKFFAILFAITEVTTCEALCSLHREAVLRRLLYDPDLETRPLEEIVRSLGLLDDVSSLPSHVVGVSGVRRGIHFEFQIRTSMNNLFPRSILDAVRLRFWDKPREREDMVEMLLDHVRPPNVLDPAPWDQLNLNQTLLWLALEGRGGYSVADLLGGRPIRQFAYTLKNALDNYARQPECGTCDCFFVRYLRGSTYFSQTRDGNLAYAYQFVADLVLCYLDPRIREILMRPGRCSRDIHTDNDIEFLAEIWNRKDVQTDLAQLTESWRAREKAEVDVMRQGYFRGATLWESGLSPRPPLTILLQHGVKLLDKLLSTLNAFDLVMRPAFGPTLMEDWNQRVKDWAQRAREALRPASLGEPPTRADEAG